MSALIAGFMLTIGYSLALILWPVILVTSLIALYFAIAFIIKAVYWVRGLVG